MPDATCKDCVAEHGTQANHRPAPYPGPRCSTHWRATKKKRSAAAKSKRVEKVYGITEEEYQALYEAQGGRCAICQRATGKTKRLAVDHDHFHCSVCAGPQTCGAPEAIRCLACGPCNQQLGRWGLASLARAANVLVRPAAPGIIRAIRERREH